MSIDIIKSIINADPSADTIDENLKIKKNGRMGGKYTPLTDAAFLVAGDLSEALKRCAFAEGGRNNTLPLEMRQVILARLKKWDAYLNYELQGCSESNLRGIAAQLPMDAPRFSPSNTPK